MSNQIRKRSYKIWPNTNNEGRSKNELHDMTIYDSPQTPPIKMINMIGQQSSSDYSEESNININQVICNAWFSFFVT